MDEKTVYLGTGRRKTSVARVRLSHGSGLIRVNRKDLDVFFTREDHRLTVNAPLRLTKTLGKYDVTVRVNGGGISGQAGAVSLGVARALVKADSSLEPTLRENRMLTRDSRMKERKKYGRKGARKGFQFSKR
ncbi:MAG TPA: 30S ribosomal protein S9 [Planctomycetota bacterium]|nr:30S ribosomal protein S9 [Planctomycetota bacterium]